MDIETSQPDPMSRWNALSAREQEVALLLGRGDTCAEIALALGISVKTVDTHRGHILQKLGVKNNAKLVLFLVREGHVQP